MKIFLVLIGSIFGLFLTEIVLRFYNPYPFQALSGEIQLPANRTYNYRFQGKETVLKYNARGFRGPELSKHPENVLKIIALGGSTTECRALTEGKTWPDLFASKIRDTGISLWHNNAGISGHSTYGHLQLYRNSIRALRPDYVFLLVGINDVGRSDLLKQKREERAHGFAHWPKSHLFQTVKNIYRTQRVIAMNPARTGFQIDALDVHPGLERSIEDALYQQQRESYIPPYKRRLSQLLEEILADEVTPILLTQPLLYGDVRDDVTGVSLSNRSLRGENYDATNMWSFPLPLPSIVYWKTLELYNDVTRDLAQKYDLLLIDLAKEMPKSTLYFYDSMHFTEQGAQKVADIIFEQISTESHRSVQRLRSQ